MIYPVISLDTNNDNVSAPKGYLSDGTPVSLTESNVMAIMQGFESGLITKVRLPQPQLPVPGHECPVIFLKDIYSANDFKKDCNVEKILRSDDNTALTVSPAAIAKNVTIPQNIANQIVPTQNSCNNGGTDFNPAKAVKLLQQFCGNVSQNLPLPAKKESFNAAEASEYIMRLVPFVQCNGAIYLYKGTYYQLCEIQRLYRLIRENLREETTCKGTHGFIKDIARFIQTDAEEVDFNSLNFENKIMFSNCVLNLDTFQMERHGSHNFNTYALSVPLVSTANLYMPVFSKYINDLADGNEVLIRRIWEALGLLLSNDIKAKRIVVLVGKGNTGKSVFGNAVRELIENKTITSFTPQKLTDRFIGAQLVNSAVNICMDLPSVPLDPAMAAMLKNLSGGDIVTGEIKYMNNFSYIYQGHLLFGSNYPICLNYRDEALADRLLMIPCQNPIPKHLQDPNLLEKIKPELPAIATYAVMCFAKVRKNNYFFSGDDIYSVSAESIYTKASLNVTVNNESEVSVEYFVEQMCEFTYDKNDFISTAELHKKYGEFCMKNNLQVEKNANTFSRKIRKIFPDNIEKNRKRLGKDENVNVWYGVVLKE